MPRHNPKHQFRPAKSTHPQAPPQLSESIRTDSSLVHLDGRTLEGGGQLVRLALTLSALTSIPIHIYHIRGNRSARSSGKGGGLKSSHLAALEFLANATAAKTWGAWVGSTEIVFEPGKDKEALREQAKGKPKAGPEQIHEIRLDKPGSVWLILQAILPYIIFAASSSPINLLLTGGTNVPKSMSGEYVLQVLLPTLALIGLPTPTLTIHSRGWTHGRTPEIGEVRITIPPLPPGAPLPAFTLTARGTISKIVITVLAATESMRTALVHHTTSALQTRFPHLPNPEIALCEDSEDAKRLYILLVAHTSTRCRIGRDWLYDEKIKMPLDEAAMGVIAQKMAERVVGELEGEVEGGGCVDEWMRDQLVVFEALGLGRSVVDGGVMRSGSLHTQTCRWVVEQIFGDKVTFDGDGNCAGIGFAAGEIYGEKRTVQENECCEGKARGADGMAEDAANSSDAVIDGELVRELDDLVVTGRSNGIL